MAAGPGLGVGENFFEGAAGGAVGLLEGRACGAFLLAVLADVLRVGCGPSPGEELAVVGGARQQLAEDVVDAGPDVEVVAVGAADEAHQGRAAFVSGVSASSTQLYSHQPPSAKCRIFRRSRRRLRNRNRLPSVGSAFSSPRTIPERPLIPLRMSAGRV